MNTIALPEWSPNLIIKRTGWGACGAEMSHEFQYRRQFHAASIETERYGS
jgi:hypothetical protein